MAQVRIHSFEHVPFEGLAHIAKWAHGKNYQIGKTLFYEANFQLPQLSDFDWLIVMGGSMNIYEEEKFPWLKVEKEFIKKAMDAGKVVLGICLGAQLIADVLGAEVKKNHHKEIGWFPVSWLPAADKFPVFKKFPEGFMAFHWHGDTFDIPPQCVHLAETDACEHQAFIHENGKVIGLQFHLEATQPSIKAIIQNCRDELKKDWHIQSEPEILAHLKYVTDINMMMELLLENIEHSCF